MKKLLFYCCLVFVLGCAGNSTEKQPQTEPAAADKTQKKVVSKNDASKVKLMTKEEAMQQKKMAEEKQQSASDGFPKTITPDKAAAHGRSLGNAYCLCINEKKAKEECDGIQRSMNKVITRYEGEIRMGIINAFKETTRNCK